MIEAVKPSVAVIRAGTLAPGLGPIQGCTYSLHHNTLNIDQLSFLRRLGEGKAGGETQCIHCTTRRLDPEKENSILEDSIPHINYNLSFDHFK